MAPSIGSMAVDKFLWRPSFSEPVLHHFWKIWLICFDNVIYSLCLSYSDYNIHGANPVVPENINSWVDWAFDVGQHAWSCACALDWHEPSPSPERGCCFSSCCWWVLVGSIHLVSAASLKVWYSVSRQKLTVWFYERLIAKKQRAHIRNNHFYCGCWSDILNEKRGATLCIQARGIEVQREFFILCLGRVQQKAHNGFDVPPLYWLESRCDPRTLFVLKEALPSNRTYEDKECELS